MPSNPIVELKFLPIEAEFPRFHAYTIPREPDFDRPSD